MGWDLKNFDTPNLNIVANKGESKVDETIVSDKNGPNHYTTVTGL
jgi:hypothetical protein